MRTIRGGLVALAVLVGLAVGSQAADRDQALALIDQAIKAHGGEQAVAKTQTMVRNAKGVIVQFGKDVPFTDEMSVQLPDRWRLALVVGEGNQQLPLLFVVNKDRGWQVTAGAASELSKQRLDELLEQIYVLWVSTLVPLKKDGAFELAPLPETRVGGQPAVGVKVARAGRTDVKLWFDKGTGLLVKVERRSKEAGETVDREYYYSDYKEFDGVKLPARQVELANGKRQSEVTSATYRLPTSLDERQFSKP